MMMMMTMTTMMIIFLGVSFRRKEVNERRMEEGHRFGVAWIAAKMKHRVLSFNKNSNHQFM